MGPVADVAGGERRYVAAGPLEAVECRNRERRPGRCDKRPSRVIGPRGVVTIAAQPGPAPAGVGSLFLRCVGVERDRVEQGQRLVMTGQPREGLRGVEPRGDAYHAGETVVGQRPLEGVCRGVVSSCGSQRLGTPQPSDGGQDPAGGVDPCERFRRGQRVPVRASRERQRIELAFVQQGGGCAARYDLRRRRGLSGCRCGGESSRGRSRVRGSRGALDRVHDDGRHVRAARAPSGHQSRGHGEHELDASHSRSLAGRCDRWRRRPV